MVDTLVIFDWDDTLSPSSRGIDDLRRLKKNVNRCIDALVSRDNVEVVIITNSQLKYVHDVFPSLSVPIYSARDLYCKQSSYREWKPKMFRHVVREKSPKQVIGIGDREADGYCAQSMAKQFGVLAKSIQFVPNPTQKQIEAQLKYLSSFFETIAQSKDQMSLKINVA